MKLEIGKEKLGRNETVTCVKSSSYSFLRAIMDLKNLLNWIPKVLVIGFVLSLILPAYGFVHGMSRDSFIIWVVRLAWVLVLSVGCGLVSLILGRLKGRKVLENRSREK